MPAEIPREHLGSALATGPDVAMDVLRRIESGARAAPGKPIRVRAAPEIIRWIESQGEGLRAALARRGAVNVELEEDETCSRERFDVATIV